MRDLRIQAIRVRLSAAWKAIDELLRKNSLDVADSERPAVLAAGMIADALADVAAAIDRLAATRAGSRDGVDEVTTGLATIVEEEVLLALGASLDPMSHSSIVTRIGREYGHVWGACEKLEHEGRIELVDRVDGQRRYRVRTERMP